MEIDFVRWLTQHAADHPLVERGIGDDAAVVRLRSEHLVATADLLIDGVHFRLAEHTPERVGRKSLAVNLSDLAAMAAQPRGALVSLALPRDAGASLARRLIDGMRTLGEQFDCPLVGGDTNVGDGPLVVAITAFGEPSGDGPVLRSTARPGDVLLVTGPLGGSLLGGHLDFTPRVDEAIALVASGGVHAMMDLSDGLAIDLHRMVEASGVGAVIDQPRVPIAKAAHTMAVNSGKTPLEHALSDGEDFELLLAVDTDRAQELQRSAAFETFRVGEVIETCEVLLRSADGSTQPLPAQGFVHQ